MQARNGQTDVPEDEDLGEEKGLGLGSTDEQTLYTGEIPGLKYQKDFITEEEAQALLKEIYDREEVWDLDKDKKRVQIYVRILIGQHKGLILHGLIVKGYNYLNPELNRSQERAFPEFLKPFVQRMQQALGGDSLVAQDLILDQAIIGEYEPGKLRRSLILSSNLINRTRDCSTCR